MGIWERVKKLKHRNQPQSQSGLVQPEAAQPEKSTGLEVRRWIFFTAYNVLPYLLFAAGERPGDYFIDDEDPPGASLAASVMRNSRIMVYPEGETAFEMHRVLSDEDNDCYIVEYAAPPIDPVTPVYSILFSAVLRNRADGTISYYYLEEEYGYYTGLYQVTRERDVILMGPGPEPTFDKNGHAPRPSIDAFVKLLKARYRMFDSVGNNE